MVLKATTTLSHSSAGAEYWGVANDVVETTWLHNLLRELHTPLLSATLVYCDNVSVVYLSANPVPSRYKYANISSPKVFLRLYLKNFTPV
ncbi:ribonuclease H-like domain-containing protein [Tanacetum coccineum]